MKYKEEILITRKKLRNKTVISFTVFIIFLAAVILSWKWLNQQPKEAAALKPLRTALDYNQHLFGKFFSDDNLVKTYPLDTKTKALKLNGFIGMKEKLDSSAWRLKVAKSPGDTLYITLDELKTLPKTELVFDFKCIEGWSQITHWAGVKFSDFTKHYHLDAEAQMKYAGLTTPDGKYYVGIDMPSILHPQTILCYEMNGRSLPLNQGYPLRLIIPVKYGIKHLKRIGTISFSNERPADYWYERGYDYYSGL